MHCDKVTRQLQFYIDDRLPLAEMRALETHISTCPICRNNLMLLEEIASTLRELDMVTEPADLTENIMRRVSVNVQAERERAEEPRYECWQRS